MKCDMKSEKGAEGGVKPSQFPTRTHGLVSSVYERAELWPWGKMSHQIPQVDFSVSSFLYHLHNLLVPLRQQSSKRLPKYIYKRIT
jgi:hypothetical protein